MPLTLGKKNHQITFKRVLGHLIGEQNGPTVVFLCGIHGNEPAGVKAINQVFNKIVENKNHVHGHCYAIAGNLNALQKKVRFQDMDLNRIWTLNNVARILENGPNPNIHEEQELTELHAILFEILQKHPPPFYFIDLHTTSAESPPFLVVNDSLLNRRFVSHYPLPIVLGIEEYLEGALLSYMNELGFVAFGFEGGKHDSPEAVSNCENFVRSTLLLTGTIEKVDGHTLSWLKNNVSTKKFRSM